ncbi:c-type cytochrome biogenesis protein CcmI [Bradyrhizobium sp. WBOS7]|uniref:C-type cytochrome biogenesis protein CcmI n=1 Tax=Bradyrhizobium betae TaxID=244734 RepID=A0AAE9N8W5_9BRAD|nr:MULTISPECIES: c-type cytochrome biogenesis protein CcmI [Bradyrhizobium]MDD1571962.1 c-type cytochrome biogenesis protein CcmI [Bradyrhizobium sp. WBOS1]UUO36118.1 c-type cytochrome biogenesis protein CcmI [Bradyrhizobium sp. WBOS01]MDD1526826.1 c-type cytochrome biogenesis protein CcmI [Bradyrhizobium sp. WBOS2]MDD1575466.1 c-type cytochrome biogenesis protein CcmI [Bradyrhizobium sp. WBOS7]MDD1600929.1 c-type cytochrome biogenesis protein CcmI [Bradyrhizobium sp. WBOS16]
MTLWFVFALMTVAAIFAVLWPLGRTGRAEDQGSEVAVYKDQLAEIERDLAAGSIPAPDAEAARIEISRRLLAAAASEPAMAATSNVTWRRAAAVLALAGLPLVAVGVYMPLGSPKLQDFPLAQRERVPGKAQSLENLVAQVQQHLETNPTDGRGWNVLAPVLQRLGRFDDAVRAYRNSLTYNGESAERRADLGEAIAAAAGGVVTAEAKTEFERAHALDADDPKANYFLGLAAEQDGRKDDAANIWRGLLAKAPADAPWRALVQTSLARVGGGGTMPVLSDETIAASKDMAEGDRNAMVRGMVERLATRLKQNGDDVESWLRLVRAYLVMGEREKAMGASADARQAVASDGERLRQLNEGLRTLGLGG